MNGVYFIIIIYINLNPKLDVKYTSSYRSQIFNVYKMSMSFLFNWAKIFI